MIGVSLRAPRSKPRYRSAVATSRLLLRTAVASESIFQTRPRRCAPKSAPTDEVSELPLVPTNAAPTWTSQRGGGGGAGACAAEGRAAARQRTRREARRIAFMAEPPVQRAYRI